MPRLDLQTGARVVCLKSEGHTYKNIKERLKECDHQKPLSSCGKLQADQIGVGSVSECSAEDTRN